MLANPSSVQPLLVRHHVVQALRDHLNKTQFVEVTTPLLTAGAGGAVARPFETEATELEGQKLNLRIAPELWLKRLIVGGMSRIYEIGPAFRNEGVDATHNPEFTICEFYEACATLDSLMTKTELLLREMKQRIDEARAPASSSPISSGSPRLRDLPEVKLDLQSPFRRLEFLPALESAMKTPLPNLSTPSAHENLLSLFAAQNLDIPSNPTLPRLLDALAAHYLEPLCDQPTFITHHPAALSPLSKHFRCPTTGQTIAARAELFIHGREFANMYEEENSPFAQRSKFLEQLRYRAVDGEGDGQKDVDESYLEALEWGMPPTGGWGCGVDRLVMLFSGRERMSEVLAFGSLRNVVGLGRGRSRRSLEELAGTVKQLSQYVGFSEDDPRAEQDESVRHGEWQASGIDAAPPEVLRDAALENDEQSLQNTPPSALANDAEAKMLLSTFRTRYGRWIGIKESDDETWNMRTVRYPLLFTACCLVATRHSSEHVPHSEADRLFFQAKDELSASLLQTRQPLAFFQAVLILSLWSTTAGQQPLSLDSWLITGYALQHSLAPAVFQSLNNRTAKEQFAALSVRNHLCLSHLHACISTRRTAVVTSSDIELSRQLLNSGSSSKFETCKVAELALYWILYEHRINGTLHGRSALHHWKLKWARLFDQSRHQFLLMSYSFGQLLMCEQVLGSKSVAVHKSLLEEMLRHSSSIMQLAIDTTDARTKHLTDHVYHIIAFAAVTALRLMSRYRKNLQASTDIGQMETLVSKTVEWLDSIEPVSNAGRTMSDVIKATQRKLGSRISSSTQMSPPALLMDSTKLAVPDLHRRGENDLDSTVVALQHHATELKDGSILIFDNGVYRHHESFPYSRIIQVDRATKQIVWQYHEKNPMTFFTPFMGGAQRLANGNTLITEAANGRIFEVTMEGETVWEYVVDDFATYGGLDAKELEGMFDYPANATFRAYKYTPEEVPWLSENSAVDGGQNMDRTVQVKL
ncbi:hypothetical protein D0862_13212 [Hortaea werneckii]|uniref:Aminoacyl-transfer RNA synthetases class-II family profile domain-containing protein n=1 Tax=Hortaea werneckii TaxID=91943 RepID=A0A3M7ERR0_HORWE|nr:hypothetical protein D0862_13212 [Hortaea werneckii]